MTLMVLTVLAVAVLTIVGIWLAGRRALRRLGIEPMAALVWLGLADTPVDEEQHVPSAQERAARRAEERRGRAAGTT